MSSFCLGCGNSLAEGERFCSICGRDSATAATVPPVDPAVAFGLPAETSGKAIFSVISGLIIVFFPFSISAVIFGYLALSDIRKSPGRLTGRGLAITGIVLGYMGVAFTIGVIGLGIYGIRTAEKAEKGVRRTKSGIVQIAGNEDSAVSALRTLNTAEIAYAQAHRDAGYTCSLRELSSAWGISDELATGKKNGYVFALQGCKAEKLNGPVVKYQLVAYPVEAAKQEAPAYCSDQSDVIRVSWNGSGGDCLRGGIELKEAEITHPRSWSGKPTH